MRLDGTVDAAILYFFGFAFFAVLLAVSGAWEASVVFIEKGREEKRQGLEIWESGFGVGGWGWGFEFAGIRVSIRILLFLFLID